MKPEYHVEHITDGCYISSIEVTKENGTHMECQLSIEDVGNLLQGKAIELLFLNDDYELKGMIDIKLSDNKTKFNISDKLNTIITDYLNKIV